MWTRQSGLERKFYYVSKTERWHLEGLTPMNSPNKKKVKQEKNPDCLCSQSDFTSY